MDAIKREKMGSKTTETPPIRCRKHRVKMIPVTLRIADWWLERIKKVAEELSFKEKRHINHCDLIRDIVFVTYVNKRLRTIFPRSCKECSERARKKEGMDLLKACLAADSRTQGK